MFFKRAKQNKKKSSDSQAEEAGSKSVNGAALPDTALQSRAVDPKSLGFETTAEIEPSEGSVGQARALEQLAFGAGMKGPGYNIRVIGGDEFGLSRRGAQQARGAGA